MPILTGTGILFQSANYIDADAQSYVDAIIAAGANVSDTQLSRISGFYTAAKEGGYYTSLKRLYLPIWGVVAANAIDMITLASGTFNGGVTHGAGFVQGNGSTGWFDYNTTLGNLSITRENAFIGYLMKTPDTRTGTRAISGAYSGATRTLDIRKASDTSISSRNHNSTASLTTIDKNDQLGIAIFGRNNTVDGYIRIRRSTLVYNIDTTVSAISGALSTANIAALAYNGNSFPVTTFTEPTDAELGSYFVGDSMSSAIGLINTFKKD